MEVYPTCYQVNMVPFKWILTGTNHLPCYARRLQAGTGSIPVGRDPFNSDQAGMPLSLQVILCCKFSLCNNVAIVFNYLLCYQVIVKESALHCQLLNSTTVMC